MSAVGNPGGSGPWEFWIAESDALFLAETPRVGMVLLFYKHVSRFSGEGRLETPAAVAGANDHTVSIRVIPNCIHKCLELEWYYFILKTGVGVLVACSFNPLRRWS